MFLFLLSYSSQTQLTCTRGRFYHPNCGLMEGRQGGASSSRASRWERYVRRVEHAHAVEETSRSAHWRNRRCASAAAKGPFKGSHWRRVGHSQDTLPSPFHRLSAWISIRLTNFLSLPEPDGWFFQLKAEEGKPPPAMLPPHPSLIQFALICREPHLSLRAGGEWDEGWASTLSLYEPRALKNKSGLRWDNNRSFLWHYTDAFRSH